MRRKHLVFYLLAFVALLAAPGAAPAQDQPDKRQILRSLKFQSGTVALRNGLATINLGSNFFYLGTADTETLLVKLWGNPPGTGAHTLGLLVPKDADLLGRDGWAIVVGYEDSGYVSDEDADKINYADLLKEMQQATAENNKERQEQGYPAMTLVGWAKSPYYDRATHKLYWAKRLRFADASEDTLNYNIRVLGRSGVLTLNAIASMGQLAMVDHRLPDVLAMVSFNQSHTYAEFDPKTDRTAEYTIAGLIAGGVLAKVGFFKALWLGIIAFKKFILIGAVALFGSISAFVKRLFGRSRAPSS
jgi:uncharacterized membrane-anchored protein